jgi:PAS domain S-box-containing protein
MILPNAFPDPSRPAGPTPITGDRAEVARVAAMRGDLLDMVDASVVATTQDGIVTEWNLASERLYGWSRDEVLGHSVFAFDVGPAEPALLERITVAMQAEGCWSGTFEVHRKDGTSFPAYVRCAVIFDGEGQPDGMVSVSSDLTGQLRIEHELDAAHDYMLAVTDHMVEGVCTCDVHGNLTYMNAAAERMFGLTMAELEGQSMHAATHWCHADGTPFPREECPITKVRHGEGTRVESHDVFVRGDGSLFDVSYTAAGFETAGGVQGTVVVFSDISDRCEREREQERRLERMAWVGRIRDALDHDRFVLHRQPIVDVHGREPIQQELLIRMIDADGELVAPGRFLPAAEEHGLIGEIDRWVIGQAVALAAEGEPVEFNLSAQSVADRSGIETLEAELARTGADPSLLVVEVTETGLLADDAQAVHLSTRLAALGCGLALDDFGTGYGSFSHLKHLSVDYLKIDVDFVRDLTVNASSRHVVESVVGLARGLGLRTVAEGVEDEQTFALVRDLGVDRVQGYLTGRPAPPPARD